MAKYIVQEKTFGGRTDEGHALDVLARHEAEVKRTIAPGRLLVFDVAEGWEPLCRFLGVAVPEGRVSAHQFHRRISDDVEGVGALDLLAMTN